jgi:hypothetical protein
MHWPGQNKGGIVRRVAEARKVNLAPKNPAIATGV